MTSVTFSAADPNMSGSGTYSTVVTLEGSGFASDDCANIAKIGGCQCTVANSTSTMLECTPDPSCDYEAGVYQEVSLNVNQYGNALVEINAVEDQSVAFVPTVDSISPNSGSTEGGTDVIITGSGFSSLETVTVTFNGIAADCGGFNPLVCTSPMSSSGDVVVYEGQFAALCTGNCTFTYDSQLTPTITDVDPTSVSGSTQLTLTGTGFGTDMSQVTVSIGGEDCVVDSVDLSTTVVCTVAAVPAGNNTIDLIVSGEGRASTTERVSGEATVTDVSPATGSVHGGTEVTFTGHGFSGQTSVTAGGVEICTDVTIVSLTEMSCTTAAHVDGAVDFIIESNGETYPSISYTYSDAITPTVTSVSPLTGAAGDIVDIAGSNFGSDASAIHVWIGNVECTSVILVGSTISCSAGELTTGTYPVQVHVVGKGLSNDDQTFTYVIEVSGISPSTGDSLGNQLLTIAGSGFASSQTVTVCGATCTVESATPTEIVCATPPKDGEYICSMGL